MMKTITEYQPMIFSALMGQAESRRSRSRHTLRWLALTLALGYVVLGLKVTADTGLAAWDWQFWIILAPLLMLGEQVLRSLARR